MNTLIKLFVFSIFFIKSAFTQDVEQNKRLYPIPFQITLPNGLVFDGKTENQPIKPSKIEVDPLNPDFPDNFQNVFKVYPAVAPDFINLPSAQEGRLITMIFINPINITVIAYSHENEVFIFENFSDYNTYFHGTSRRIPSLEKSELLLNKQLSDEAALEEHKNKERQYSREYMERSYDPLKFTLTQKYFLIKNEVTMELGFGLQLPTADKRQEDLVTHRHSYSLGSLPRSHFPIRCEADVAQ